MEPAYPLNAWYATAWGHEVARTLSKRTVCDHDIVLFRQQDGAVAALEDACWHRLMPLSLGTLEGDTVVCGYHGLRFNGAGRCTFMPAQKTINPSAGVRSYPTVEKHRLIWLWPGDPALADPASVPDFHSEWVDDSLELEGSSLLELDGSALELDEDSSLKLEDSSLELDSLLPKAAQS